VGQAQCIFVAEAKQCEPVECPRCGQRREGHAMVETRSKLPAMREVTVSSIELSRRASQWYRSESLQQAVEESGVGE